MQPDLSTVAGWLFCQGRNAIPAIKALLIWPESIADACLFLQDYLRQKVPGKQQHPEGHNAHSLPAEVQMLLPENAVSASKQGGLNRKAHACWGPTGT